MQRVLVMGSSGSGKSTFAKRLAELTGLPKVSLDTLYWQPGWLPSDPAAFAKRATEAASSPRWIIDGNYTTLGAGELRRHCADTVIWFDLPRYVCVAGIIARVATSYGKVRSEMAEGCPERIDLEFIRYVWTYRREQRPKLLEYFEQLRPGQTFVRFASRRQSRDWLAALNPPSTAVH